MAGPWEKYQQRPASHDRPVFQELPPQPSPQTGPQRRKDEIDVRRGEADLSRLPSQIRNDQLGATEKEQATRFAPTKHGMEIVDKFRTDPAVKAYRETLPAVISMTQARPGGEGDLTVIYSWARSMDPLGSVREGDTQLAGSASSIMQRAETMANNVRAGNLLSPEQRTGLIEEARNRARQLNRSYSQVYQQYADFAKRSGLDPAILGPHEGDKFRAFEEEYVRKHNPRPRGGEGPGDIGFNAPETPKNPLSAEQQAAYDAFLRTNPKATPEQLMGFTRMIGGELDPKRAGEIIEFYRKHGKFAPGSEAVQPKPDISQIRRGNEVVDPIARGLADTATIGFSEELAAGVDTLAGAGPYGQRLDFHNAVRDYDKEKNFGKRLVGQLGGGAALPAGGVNTIRGLAGVGAGYGGAYGVGSTDGGIGQRAIGGALGAGAGGVIGAGLGAAMPLAARGAAAVGRRIAGPSSPRQQALLQAGDQENIPINASDLFPGARNTVATLETIPGASGPVRRGIEAGADALEGRVQQLGRGGTARENMGDAIQGAGTRYIERSRRQADRLYSTARNQSRDVDITPQATMQTLAQLVRQEGQVPGGTRAGAVIRRYVDAFEQGGPITIDGARAMRSELLARLRDEGGLTRSQAQRITGQIMGAVNQDIERSLVQAGRTNAVQAYRTADRFYAERMDEIENVVQKFLGSEQSPKSPEQALQTMRSMANPKGDTGRLTRMLSHLTPDERRDFAATLVEPLGRRSAEEPFSPATFVQNVRSISPAARRVIFGADGERSIQNLARIANAKRDTVQRLNNSRSGQVTNYRTMISNLIVGLPGGGALIGAGAAMNGSTGAIGGAAIGIAGVAGSRALARALMSPEFTRLIAQAPATVNPQAINNHFGRLRQLGAKDPNIRSVVESLEQQLLRGANDNLTPGLAAEERDERNQR